MVLAAIIHTNKAKHEPSLRTYDGRQKELSARHSEHHQPISFILDECVLRRHPRRGEDANPRQVVLSGLCLGLAASRPRGRRLRTEKSFWASRHVSDESTNIQFRKKNYMGRNL